MTKYYKLKAIDNNIRLARMFFDKNLSSLNEVVRIVDETVHPLTSWRKDTLIGPVGFSGQD